MDLFTREHLTQLTGEFTPPCISIYMPTHRTGREMQQDPIRLKNLLAQASEELGQRGKNQAEIEALLEPGTRLLESSEFWQQMSDGLVIYISEGRAFRFRVPLAFEELVIVGDRFHLKPILPLLEGNGRFFVLALSQNDVRLLEGTRERIRELPLEDVPTSLAEALPYDDPEQEMQYHTRTQARMEGERNAIFHGQGTGEVDTKKDIKRFFDKVDAGVTQRLNEQNAPLVLAGVEFLIPIYREANAYSHLLDKYIEGNPEALDNDELHARGWEFVEPIFHQAQENARERYRASAARAEQTTSQDIHEVVPAAVNGRVDTLFVPRDERVWGRFTGASQEVHISEERNNHDEDLLDLAAVQTLLNRGVVYAVERGEMPADGPVAAIFRYEYKA